MKSHREIPRETHLAQALASRPDASAWVSANAGSGKTHVLTQRVVRLLLDGVPASKILCLTFTKAAAANMSLRVFDTLARWTSLDDEALMAAIAATGARAHSRQLSNARKLFSRTIESPGGLKIQTIHAFCESILHMFPFEANAPAGFKIIEDVRKRELLERAKQLAFEHAASDPVLGAALESLAQYATADDFDKLLNDALGRRSAILDMARHCVNWPRGYRDSFGAALGLQSDETIEALERRVVEDGFTPSELHEVAHVLEQGGKNDGKLALLCRSAAAQAPALRADAYLNLFLNSEGYPRGSGTAQIISKAAQKLDVTLLPKLRREADRVATLFEKLKAARAIERGRAFWIVVDEILGRYQQLKRASALMDFDDLIERAQTLLSRFDAQWVLYKLDSGIDHILVDEAQDTSESQWTILEALAQEFTVGDGRSRRKRTFFAVGDEKQSIFSFQGADPKLFNVQRSAFQKRSEAGQIEFSDVALHHSFRSAPGILQAVDTVFADEANRRGLTSEGLALSHSAWKADLPSLVEIWPAVCPGPENGLPDWRLPLDAVHPNDPVAILAERISSLIASLLAPDSSQRIFDSSSGTPRAIHGGDIMILLRRRGPLFESLIASMKRKGLPVAGADRMVLKSHIAVMDLVALGNFCLLPEDDLSLACCLKSPLLELTDDDLIEFAPGRKGSLYAALCESSKETHRAALEKLHRWRMRAQNVTPFQFYSELLEADGGRTALLGRLGREAGDALDEFVRLALAGEQSAAPSLARFLYQVETGETEVRRDMEAANQAVRVMTVHASKGLESKIVILPDTCRTPSNRSDSGLFSLPLGGGGTFLVWSPSKKLDCLAIADARLRARDDRMDEYRRLLYVAMTRAEERLYIMGHHGAQKPATDCWHRMVLDALAPVCVECVAPWSPEERIWRVQRGEWPTIERGATRASATTDAPKSPPSWLFRAIGSGASAPPILRPSSPSQRRDASARPEDADSVARALEFGRLVHLLVQRLPEVEAEHRFSAAASIIGMRAPESLRRRLAQIAIDVVEHPELTPLFGPGSIAEAPVIGSVKLSDGQRVEIEGRIDRLAILGDEVWLADFKTGRADTRDSIPIDYVRQLALYSAALTSCWPQRRIRVFLVWVEGPRVIELSESALRGALQPVSAAELR